MKRPRNIVGPQVKRLREQRGLTQPMLVAKVQLLGWDLSRETLAKIETQIRWVADCELVCLAKALRVPIDALLPEKEPLTKSMRTFFRRFTAR
ncbi:MAG: helix-turn-helix transcriptional regulator [Verrucomicrobia bacterium]|nr:helix-turn-helix transcriptional regulator [Verrucomicrobiota bacterium]